MRQSDAIFCGAGRFGMPAACALGMISGKYIFNFGIAERLRTLRYPIFTGGGGVTENGSSGTCFLRKCGAAEGNCQSPDFRGGGCGQGEQTVGNHPIFAQKVCKNI